MNSTSSTQWQRISPLAIIFFIFGIIRQVGIQALPGLAVAYTAFGRKGDSDWLPLVLAATGLLLLGFGLLSYLRFRYTVTSERVLVRKGVLHREELDVEFDRIQNINIREPFYMRPFGLAVLALDTAGSSSKEIELIAISKTLALDIRGQLLGAIPKDSAEPDSDPQAPTRDASTLLSLSRKDVLMYGLTANMMLWLVIAVGAIFGSGDFSETFFDYLKSSPLLLQGIEFVREQGGNPLLGLAVVALTLMALMLLPVISMLGALLRFDGYQLTVRGDTFRKSSGLLTRHDESVRQHKIQALEFKQNFMARWLGRVNVRVRQTSAGSGIESGQLPTGIKAQFMVPVLRPEQANDLGGLFLPGSSLNSSVLSTIDTGRYVRVHLAMVLLITLIPAALLSLLHVSFMALLLVVGLPAWLILRRVASKFAWAVNGEYGAVQYGFLGQTTTMFPLFKIQRIDIRQTPFHEKSGIANVTVHLASHSLNLPYVRMKDASRLRDLAIYYAESSTEQWY